ncbi:MAG TPA: hypothetical protein VFQ67_01615 [Allosphingosinicella sp.]|nr:hypothetical protein [Allosphingosinicella sp.]
MQPSNNDRIDSLFDDEDIEDLAMIYRAVSQSHGDDAATGSLMEAASGVIAMEAAEQFPAFSLDRQVVQMVVAEAAGTAS